MHEFEDWVTEDMGFALDADDFDPCNVFEEVRMWLEDNGQKVVQEQGGLGGGTHYLTGITNYTKWGFTYLDDEDVWEFEWEIDDNDMG